MESLPLDVLCLILEQCEVSAWFLQLRAVSRSWRRGVERVAARNMPLALCLHGTGCSEVLTWVSVTENSWALPSFVPVGCGVVHGRGTYLRLEGSALVLVAKEPHKDSRMFYGGHGFVLAFDKSGGTLVQFHASGSVTRTPVRPEVVAAVRLGEASEMAADGSVVGCFRECVDGVTVEMVRRTHLPSGRVREEGRWDWASGDVTHCVALVGERFGNVTAMNRGQVVFTRLDMATGERTRFGVPETLCVGGHFGDFVNVRNEKDGRFSFYDFAFNRLVPLELPPGAAGQLMGLSYQSVSDVLLVVCGKSFCAIVGRRNGRLLWYIESPTVYRCFFVGPSLVLFTSTGVLKVDCRNPEAARDSMYVVACSEIKSLPLDRPLS